MSDAEINEAMANIKATFAKARKQAKENKPDETPIDLFSEYSEEAKKPNWSEFDDELGAHVHDWRTYITDEVRTIWFKLPLLSRCAIVACCEEMAHNEQWD